MESLGVAASVIAVITIGVQSSKAIFETVSGIRGGPTTVASVATVARNLSKLLEYIKGLAKQAEETLGEHDAKFFETLNPLLCECVVELQLIRETLGKFIMTSDCRLWNNVKTYLHEKDFDKMWNSIQHYVQLFGSHLSHAGVHVGLLNAEYLRLIGDEITAISSDMNQRLNSLQTLWSKGSNRLDAYHQEINSALRLQHGTVEASAGHQSKKLDGLRSGLTQLSNLTNKSLTKWDRLETNLGERNRTLVQTVDSVSDRLQDVFSMSSAQSATVQQLGGKMQSLQFGIQGIRDDLQPAAHCTRLKGAPSCFATSRGKVIDSDSLYGSVRRLCNLAGTKDKVVCSAEAQSIICDLGQIIAPLFEDRIPTANVHDTLHNIGNILRTSRRLRINGPRNVQEQHNCTTQSEFFPDSNIQPDCSRILERPLLRSRPAASKKMGLSNDVMVSDVQTSDDTLARRCLSSTCQSKPTDDAANHRKAALRKRHGTSYCLEKRSNPVSASSWAFVASVDSQDCTSKTKCNHSCSRYISENGFFSRQTTAGRVDIQFQEQSLREHVESSGTFNADETSAEETFSARVALTPDSNTNLKAQAILDVSQALTKTNNILSTPMLSFRTVLPRTSEIFQTVQYGSLCDLQKALSEGSASNTDCDPDGRSLLTYALHALRPTIVGFLLKVGADVNSLDKSWDGIPRLPLEIVTLGDRGISLRVRSLRVKCMRLLLAHDADPSLMSDADGPMYWSAFYSALSRCSSAILRTYLDLGSPFISPSSTGTDVLRLSPLSVASVLSFGCFYCPEWETSEKNALLLARGANVNHRDFSGNNCLHILIKQHKSPSSVSLERLGELRDILMLMITAGADVYAVNDREESISDVAHRSGHDRMWSEALETCGYDVLKVLRGDNADLVWYSAVDNLHTKTPAEMGSKLSFADYLAQRQEKRKASCRVMDLSDYENVEEEGVRQTRFQKFEGGKGQLGPMSACYRYAESDSGSDVYEEESSEMEDDNEAMWNWNKDGNPTNDEEGSKEPRHDELKIDQARKQISDSETD